MGYPSTFFNLVCWKGILFFFVPVKACPSHPSFSSCFIKSIEVIRKMYLNIGTELSFIKNETKNNLELPEIKLFFM